MFRPRLLLTITKFEASATKDTSFNAYFVNKYGKKYREREERGKIVNNFSSCFTRRKLQLDEVSRNDSLCKCVKAVRMTKANKFKT